MITSKTSRCIVEDCGQYDKVEIDGLSLDYPNNVPMKGIATGSIFLAVDSQQLYFFVQQFEEVTDPDGKVTRTEVEGYWLEA